MYFVKLMKFLSMHQCANAIEEQHVEASLIQYFNSLAFHWLPQRPNNYWTTEMRCCGEYLRLLALCERGKS
ncbi:hypothetical protein [Xanthomonas phaseoli]|uniref:hypothetical protein n=1 Tax=Xanthomonas phaseoli TaxID=1985254 RepID=UPI00036F79E2|nr:hypothetical protein [Xanthomonas phaseoli]MCC8532457.1 hypothetical protein [Xanthomonas phaseoli]